jgi:hypothetical protein
VEGTSNLFFQSPISFFNENNRLFLGSLAIFCLLLAVKRTLRRLMNPDISLEFDAERFWNLSWFRPNNPYNQARRLGVQHIASGRSCERISNEEYEYQAKVLTRAEIRKLVNSDGYKLYA